MWPTILAHELSHYLYDLRDEYNNGSACQNNIGTQASLMEGYGWSELHAMDRRRRQPTTPRSRRSSPTTPAVANLQQGEPTEFCHAGNHDTTADNNQNNINGKQSCWTYMAADANHNNIAVRAHRAGRRWPDRGQHRQRLPLSPARR